MVVYIYVGPKKPTQTYMMYLNKLEFWLYIDWKSKMSAYLHVLYTTEAKKALSFLIYVCLYVSR